MRLLPLLLLLTACAPHRYVLDVATLEATAAAVKGMDGDGSERAAMMEATQQRLHEAYPELIAAPPEGAWWFNAVGGSLAEIQVLWCSPHEYVALWGAPVPTDGFSGRYRHLDVWDVMLSGHMESYAPGQHVADVYVNGGGDGAHDTSFLAHGVGKHFALSGGATMIDYGRGWLPSALKDGARLGHRYVTGDSWSRHQMIRTCRRQTFQNWFDPARREAIRRYRAANDTD